ncbi:hypothetical protein HDU77_003806 [Chytriomyces hyalinus]|nr:hypothetical protein HDU77_003806 [Chytriomyces hyalinus]
MGMPKQKTQQNLPAIAADMLTALSSMPLSDGMQDCRSMLFHFDGDELPEEMQTPRSWAEVRKSIQELELPEGQFFVVRYVRRLNVNGKEQTDEAGWPVEWELEPRDALLGVLMLSVADAAGIAAIKNGWEGEASVVGVIDTPIEDYPEPDK